MNNRIGTFVVTLGLLLVLRWYSGCDLFERDPYNATYAGGALVVAAIACITRTLIK